MKKYTFLLAIITLSFFSAFGQNTASQSAVCTDETLRNVSSRGIKIGASSNDIVNLIAETEEDRQRILGNYLGSAKNGYKAFSFSPNLTNQQQNEKFSGTSDYYFTFLDDDLAGLSVTYSKPIWRDAEQFAESLTKFFDLPKIENWKSESGMLTLQCGNYKIIAQTNSGINRSSFNIYDTRISQIVADRSRKAFDEQLEKDLKTFRP